MYIHELKDWPRFQWDHEKIHSHLIRLRHKQGLLLGKMELLGFQFKEEMVLQNLTQDVVKSSAIEGEVLDQTLVRSSIARHLGMDVAANGVDRHVEGVVEMMLDATQNYEQPLTEERFFGWHSSLFPTGRSGLKKIRVGEWRIDSVQVISGPLGREKIHFEGPPANKVKREMRIFIDWLNGNTNLDLVLKSAIAHLWFVTIHPFDDGNGRIGRALVDLLLARSEKTVHRFYSLSAQIQIERKDYYQILEKSQKDGLDITPWMTWFFDCLERAIDKALFIFQKVKSKEQIWKSFSEVSLNERQKKLINRLLDGFQGKLTTSKWAKIAKCSQDTAYRDIVDLVNKGVLIKNSEGGRSTSYSLRIKEQN